MSVLNNDEKILSGDEITLAGLSGDEIMLAGIKSANSVSSKARKEFIARMKSFPKDVQNGLLNGSLQLVDVSFYSMRDLINGQTEVFKKNDDIVDGERNIANAKIPTDRPMLLTHLEIQQSSANIATGFDAGNYSAGFKRAEVELKYDKYPAIEKVMIGSLMGRHVNGYNTEKPYGVIELINPKVLLAEKNIEVNITGTVSTGAVLVALSGVTVAPVSTFSSKA